MCRILEILFSGRRWTGIGEWISPRRVESTKIPTGGGGEAYIVALERDTLEGYSDFLAIIPAIPWPGGGVPLSRPGARQSHGGERAPSVRLPPTVPFGESDLHQGPSPLLSPQNRERRGA